MLRPDTKIIFIAGIHGVGKSVFCDQLSKNLGILHTSAGDLISQAKKIEKSTNKTVENVTSNQDILITAIGSSSFNGQTFLLDGHFCLINSKWEISKIPQPTFTALNPVCSILLTDELDQIRKRLFQRDGKEYEVSMLGSMQETEVAYAKEVCRTLSIPLEILRPSEVDEATQFIKKQITV